LRLQNQIATPAPVRGPRAAPGISKYLRIQSGANIHLIAQVKANQPALHHAVAELCNTVAPLDTNQTTDKKRRSRDETRMVEVFAPGNSLADTEWDGHIGAVIRVKRDVLTRSAITGFWRSTSETALFVSDVVLPATQCAKATAPTSPRR
jgi:hypothetical protein